VACTCVLAFYDKKVDVEPVTQVLVRPRKCYSNVACTCMLEIDDKKVDERPMLDPARVFVRKLCLS